VIEPIGSGIGKVSPYDRYSQYQQYIKPDKAEWQNSLWRGQGTVPGEAAIPGQIAPPGQTGRPVGSGDKPDNGVSRKQGGANGLAAVADRECQTCKNRKYQDRSDDPGVSYQSPTSISPDKAASAVRAHENEHVSREQAKATRQGREVVSQSVVIKTAICPECGRVYISGGTTTTVTRAKDNKDSLFQPVKPSENSGLFLDKSI